MKTKISKPVSTVWLRRAVDDDRVAQIADRGIDQPEVERDGVDAADGVDALVAGQRREAVVARRAGQPGADRDASPDRVGERAAGAGVAAVVGRDRQRIGAEEIVRARIDDVVRRRERGVDLRERAGERDAAVPLPATAAPPAEATVSVPCATDSVVVIAPAPASTSAIDSPAIASAVLASTGCAPGTVFTGASLTACRWRSCLRLWSPVPAIARRVRGCRNCPA